MKSSDLKALVAFGLPPARGSALPRWAQELPLPLGLLTAEQIVAVSPTYSHEILRSEGACRIWSSTSPRFGTTQVGSGVASTAWLTDRRADCSRLANILA